jgi:hypothetical protein
VKEERGAPSSERPAAAPADNRIVLKDGPSVRRETETLGCHPGVTPEKWSGRLDSNQRPPAPKAGALPGCATPRLVIPRILTQTLTTTNPTVSKLSQNNELSQNSRRCDSRNHWGF